MDLKEQDLKQNGLLSVNHMQKQSSKKDFPKPRYMMMLRKLILEKFLESRYSQEDSHVRTSQMLERELASRGVVLHSGNITLKRLAKYDQESHSLKTSQLSLVEGYMSYSATLPRSGMMQNGIVYQLQPLVRITRGTGSSSFATPTTMDSLPPKSEKALKREMEVTRKGRSKPANLRDQVSNMQMWRTPSATECMRGIGKMSIEEKKKNNIQISLSAQVQMFPTPVKRDYKGASRKKDMLPDKVGGQLNPTFVEWLMGFPRDWTVKEDDSQRMGSKKSKRIIHEKSLREVWEQIIFTTPSYRWEQKEQLAKELDDSMPNLSYIMALGEWKEGLESAKTFLCRMQEALYKGLMRDPSDKIKETWQSLSKKDKDRAVLASIGHPHWGSGEWLGVGRVEKGVVKRVDRIKCLGNAVVPQLAEVFAKAIKVGEQ